ncbi:putative 3-hydroxyisobutyryl-CoA hydrolase [Helianthus anomalus]
MNSKHVCDESSSGYDDDVHEKLPLPTVSPFKIREGRFQTLDQCLIREYRLTSRVVSCQISSDFCEGVRARMVDKDFAPKWNPPSLEHISYDMVDEYFSPLGAFESELELSTRQPEPFHEQIRI